MAWLPLVLCCWNRVRALSTCWPSCRATMAVYVKLRTGRSLVQKHKRADVAARTEEGRQDGHHWLCWNRHYCNRGCWLAAWDVVYVEGCRWLLNVWNRYRRCDWKIWCCSNVLLDVVEIVWLTDRVRKCTQLKYVRLYRYQGDQTVAAEGKDSWLWCVAWFRETHIRIEAGLRFWNPESGENHTTASGVNENKP